ncbi:venom carboxylesterase-6-like [Ischnura elegans]|uniref:venom carboxylesterase-6-like n=1 Tax=Ischnura elegans TaxID=197161 RepID=UPI001ED8B64D|nr:venom carboxylesterase-6-like [Ischnura elegans]XP_046405773.1 venom carboxylesterase-6-like [Ischnura elegans]
MDFHTHPLFWIWLVIFHGVAITSESSEPLVNVPGHGVFKGTILTSSLGNKMHAYLGVPYAKPPVGDLRFKEPQPPEPFDGVWDSTYLRDLCMQHRHLYPEGHDQVYGQEDCLHLNIYVPKTPSSKKKSSMDVLIVIHGGGFMFGSGRYYGPNYITDRDVILVNINYRLGPLGFLSLEDEFAPGNNGLKDQVSALKWVNKNIEYFGGNPKSIHLTGLSAGGASVHFHYLSPLSRGLFQRGISVSGTALCPWALVDKPREKAMKLAAITGCPTTSDSSAILKCLRQRPATDIVSAMSHFQVWLYNPFSPFGPVVEPKGSNKPFLPDNPFNLLSNGQFLHAPWITTVTEHEGLYPAADWVANEERMEHLNNRFDELVPNILHYNDTIPANLIKTTTQKIRNFYFGNNEIGMNQREEMIQMCSDRLFLYASSKAAKLHSKFAPVYKYEFSYRGTYSITEAMIGSDEYLGIAHGDDIAYVIALSYVKPFEAKDKPISDLLLDFYTSFMQKGIPASKGVTWEKIQPEKDYLGYLSIASPRNVKMAYSNDFGNEKFWDSLGLRELHNLKTYHEEL